jgi:hypothetical protein
MRRLAAAVVLVLSVTPCWAGTAFAQGIEPAAVPLERSSLAASFAEGPSILGAADLQRALPVPPVRRPGSSSLMTSLYASTAALQALDVHSTFAAFRAGAVEANPLMQPVTKHRAAFIAVKAGVAASTILAARHLARRNKAMAVVALVAVNSAYALVVHHNYKVAQGRR